jgi:hypothetical protein
VSRNAGAARPDAHRTHADDLRRLVEVGQVRQRESRDALLASRAASARSRPSAVHARVPRCSYRVVGPMASATADRAIRRAARTALWKSLLRRTSSLRIDLALPHVLNGQADGQSHHRRYATGRGQRVHVRSGRSASSRPTPAPVARAAAAIDEVALAVPLLFFRLEQCRLAEWIEEAVGRHCQREGGRLRAADARP